MFDEIEGLTLAEGEEKRIEDALDALAKDTHAPREISVRFTLHIHNEYPKHVTVGVDENEQPIIKVVNNRYEEKAALASVAPASPALAPARPTD
jgi:hypothetical protein